MNFKAIRRVLLAENPPVNLSGRNRLQNLDVLKLMSTVLVLCLHCAEHCRGYVPDFSLWSVTQAVYCMGVLAIPVFFTVSGYQLLGRENAGYRYSVRKILYLLKSTFIFYLSVKVAGWLVLGKEAGIMDIPEQFCLSLLQQGDFGIIWFVGALILIYLCYPLVNGLYNRRKGWYLLLCVSLLLFQTFVFFITVVRPGGFPLRETNVYQTLRIWNWLGYFCIGGLIKRYEVFRYFGRLPFVAVMAAVCFVFLNMMASRRGIWYCEFGYASVPVILFVVVVFSYVLNLRVDNRFMAEMSLVFFPAYLLGDEFIWLFRDYIVILPDGVNSVVFVCVTAVCSVTSGWLMMKLPFVRKLLRI